MNLLTLLFYAALLVCFSACGKIQKKMDSAALAAPRLLDGPSVSYYSDGKKMGEAEYRGGVLHGRATSFYPNGKKKSEACYKDGVLDGKSTRWDESGKVVAEAVFSQGVLRSSSQ
jgi:antitoxin component YwqK of YwqJK toxin-antitoxin module